jgi:hypothetical protein
MNANGQLLETLTHSEIFQAYEQDQNHPLRVVIAYDGLSAGQRALRMLIGILNGIGDGFPFVPLPWAFDLLADAGWRNLASIDAIESDIVIIATNSGHSLPSAVREWAGSIIQGKRGSSAAIVALFGPEDSPHAANLSGLEEMRTAAAQAELAFFAPNRRALSAISDKPGASLPAWNTKRKIMKALNKQRHARLDSLGTMEFPKREVTPRSA